MHCSSQERTESSITVYNQLITPNCKNKYKKCLERCVVALSALTNILLSDLPTLSTDLLY